MTPAECLLAPMFMLGAGYALMRGVHIRADFLYRNWEEENQATVDALLYLAFYFPAMLFFFWVSLDYTIDAWVSWERSMDTTLMAPCGPCPHRHATRCSFFSSFKASPSCFRCFYAMGEDREAKFLALDAVLSGRPVVDLHQRILAIHPTNW